MDHPSIEQAAVVPVPDPVMGECSLACLVTRPGEPRLDIPALRQWFVGKGVAKFKTPELVEHLDGLPMTGSGKIDRVSLKRRFAGLAPPDRRRDPRRGSGSSPDAGR